ncbi:MAG: Clp protease ClpP [Beijerinckiaceae bacterium]|nr:Clp protease ClpP [Beijerinckiaceae bacterium]
MTHRLIVGGDLVLFGDVGDMWGDGSGFKAQDVLEALAEIGAADVNVRLNSGGGSAWDGVAIYNALRAHTGKVTVHVEAIAASAASVIALGGDERIMRRGAMIMIHDPANITWGTAEDHAKAAAMLNKLGDVIAGIYAAHTGSSVEDMRALMLEETWMGSDEALERKFATSTDDSEADAFARFDYRAYARAPLSSLQGAQRARPAFPAAASAHKKEPTMGDPTKTAVAAEVQATNVIPPAPAPVAAVPAPAPAPAPVAAKDVTKDIMSRCRAAKLSIDDAMAIVDAVGTGDDAVLKAQDMIINKIADRDPAPKQALPRAEVTADGRDRFKEGATRALMHRAGIAGGEVNEFSGLTIRELARESLSRAGLNSAFNDPLLMAGAALSPMMSAGMHSTSDFVEILANIANKSMLKGYEEAEETFERWTARGVLVDFKPVRRIDLGLAPNLIEVPEGAEYQYGTMGDRGETIQLATFGRMFAITRQAVVNDDMNAFTRVPMRMGRAARRTIGNLVYAVLTTNAAMADGVELFHATHNNLAGTAAAPSVDSLDLARAAMAKQKDKEGHATALNIRPRYFLVPVALEGKARVLMTSEKDPNAAVNAAKPNHVNGLAEVVSDARLDAHSPTAWYLAADPNAHDTIEVAYLNGNSSPVLEQRDGWNVDGVEFKVRIDAGVKALGYQGLYKNAGA